MGRGSRLVFAVSTVYSPRFKRSAHLFINANVAIYRMVRHTRALHGTNDCDLRSSLDLWADKNNCRLIIVVLYIVEGYVKLALIRQLNDGMSVFISLVSIL